MKHVRSFGALVRFSALVMAVCVLLSCGARASDPKDASKTATTKAPYNPTIAAASDEGGRAMRSFRVPDGLTLELFAAEPLLANPVAFTVDGKGVFYVAETFRHSAGVTDTRDHMNWLDADLACRTVADRVAMYKKYLGADFAKYTIEQDRIRRIVDRDGDGRADSATVFADGFNDPASGIGAGLLARGDDVWYACIPWLWKFKDTNGDGVADERKVLHEGYGVHVGFLGHDLHGLIMGPDGKLYFSIGDRGIHVMTREGRTLAVPDTGTVLRCDPDGAHLEVFASGLRNPQELAFDEHGNLFTCDNNSDSGDQARWVYLIEGGDSGWRIGYQFIAGPISRGPWNEEKLWLPAFAGQAAYIVPPLANISDGPSGLAHNPGVTLLPDKFKEHFFLVDFRGASAQSGIHTFANKPKGAAFELVDSRHMIWSVLATDVDFGPDGGLYFCDWVEGWNKPNKGRLYRALDTKRREDPQVKQVRQWLSEGMKSRPDDTLAGLLAYPDMRIRQEAQFELVNRGLAGARVLETVVTPRHAPLARLHAIWGLGQLGRGGSTEKTIDSYAILNPLLADADVEVRAQAAKVLGDLKERRALLSLIRQLTDPSLRVRSLAALALGKIGRPEAITPLMGMLRENNDQDAHLRHAGVMGLVGSASEAALEPFTSDASPSVRMGVLLALRRQESAKVARFLKDADPRLVLEAARAINDLTIVSAMSELAELPISASTPQPLARRILAANLRGGAAAQAERIASTAADAEVAPEMRVLALEMLGQWAAPSGRDAVTGLWRPIPPRSGDPAIAALRPRLGAVLGASSESVRTTAAHTAAALGIKDAGKILVELAVDAKQTDSTRAAALTALDRMADSQRTAAAQRAIDLPGAATRTSALQILAKTEPAVAATAIAARLDRGPIDERQGAIGVLATLKGDVPAKLLGDWLDKIGDGRAPAEIRLDLLEAAAKRPEANIRDKLKAYEAGKPKDDVVAANSELLAGGDPRRGAQIFNQKEEVACLRCHKYRSRNGQLRGGEVGPELSDLGLRQKPAYILESILNPNKQIAQGFESIVLVTGEGKVVTGVLRGEDATTVRLVTAEGQPVTVLKDNIEERKRGPSAMPADLAPKLSKMELRDLVAFLSSLKTRPTDH